MTVRVPGWALLIAERGGDLSGVVGEEGREVRGVAKPKLRCDRRDREIGMGKQAAGFQREPVLDGLFGVRPAAVSVARASVRPG
jgi:hypothetical protein